VTVVFAASDDLATWTGATAPANATTLLRSASLLISDALSADLYYVDPDTGLPTDAGFLQATNDACCSQAATWAAAGIDPTTEGLLAGGQGSIIKGKSIEGASISYDTSLSTSATVLATRQQMATTLCDEAMRILRLAGLARGHVWTVG
jgi:hypothetical protein